MAADSEVTRVAGYVFNQVDGFIGKLGKPVGVKTYKPYHSSGEDFLPSYLGMAGIPMDIVPEFPSDAHTILLTEAAKYDTAIVEKIKKQLTSGKNVVITSGLLKALQGKGIEDIIELEYTGKTVAATQFFGRGVDAKSDSQILIPEIRYATNDSWEVVSAWTSPSRTTGTPILLEARYSKGVLYVLTIPQAQGDLYSLPPEVLRAIRNVLGRDVYVAVDTPALVSLFVYDNDKFIVESFRDNFAPVKIVTDGRITKLRDLTTGQPVIGQKQGNRTAFDASSALARTGCSRRSSEERRPKLADCNMEIGHNSMVGRLQSGKPASGDAHELDSGLQTFVAPGGGACRGGDPLLPAAQYGSTRSYRGRGGRPEYDDPAVG